MFQAILNWLESRKEKRLQVLEEEIDSLGRRIESINEENTNLLYVERRIVDCASNPRDSGFDQRMGARVGTRKQNNYLLGQLIAQRHHLKKKLARLVQEEVRSE